MNYSLLCLLLLSSLPSPSSLAMSNEILCPELEEVDNDIPVPHKSAEDYNCTSIFKSENEVNVRSKRHDGTVNQVWDMQNDVENSTDTGTWTGWKLLAIVFIGLCLLFLCFTIGLAFMHFGRRGK